MQHRRQAVPLQRFRLFPFRSPLLRESRLFSLPRGTEMFQFPRFPLAALYIQAGVTGHYPSRVSPFGDPRIKARSTAPRGLSQPPTSFIGIWRQGIHRWLFVAWKNKDARARYGVLKGHDGRRGKRFVGRNSRQRQAESRRDLFLGRRALHSLKTEQRIAWSLARPVPGGSCLEETVAYDR